MNLKIMLLRHGQIQANVDGLWHGSTDSPLTEFGVAQAKETGRHLSQQLPFDKVFSSPLQRCLDTARYASGQQIGNINKVPGFAEMSIGEWEETPYSDLQTHHDFVNQSTKNLDYSAPGGESLNPGTRSIRQGSYNDYLVGSTLAKYPDCESRGRFSDSPCVAD